MYINNAVSHILASSPPLVTAEHQWAALVAKLHHQADMYAAWQLSACEGAGTNESDDAQKAYEKAACEVRIARDQLRATPAETRSETSLAVLHLQASAKRLEVTHLARLRDDLVIAGSDVKIAQCGAARAARAKCPELAVLRRIRQTLLDQFDFMEAVRQAHKTVQWCATQEVRDAVERPVLPVRTKKAAGILKAPEPASPARARKSVHWDTSVPPTSTTLSTVELSPTLPARPAPVPRVPIKANWSAVAALLSKG